MNTTKYKIIWQLQFTIFYTVTSYYHVVLLIQQQIRVKLLIVHPSVHLKNFENLQKDIFE